MKKIKLVILVFVFGIFFYSCKNEVDTLDPNVDVREVLVKTWKCNESDGKNTRTYDVTVTKDPSNTNKILIGNFHNLSASKLSVVVAGTNMTIASQSIDNYTFAGSGTFDTNGSRIQLTYSADDHTDPAVNITATYSVAVPVKKNI